MIDAADPKGDGWQLQGGQGRPVRADAQRGLDALLRAGVLCTGPMGDAKKGEAYFREILAAHPDGDQAETAFLYLATVAWWTGEWVAAERLHRAFLAKYPDSPFKEEFLTLRLPAIAAKQFMAQR